MQKKLLDQLLGQIQFGGLRLTFWDGESKVYGPEPSPKLHLTIKDPAVIKAAFKNLSLAIGEAFMAGQLEIDGPIEDLVEMAHRNQKVFDQIGASRLYKRLNHNVKDNQSKLISYHYDLGNDFYQLWLDRETMGYTCGYYQSPHDSLEQGQIQKFDHVLRKLQLKPSHSLLDIGFGWGYLLIRAAKLYGVKGYGVTLSQEQLQFARDWAAREGVADLVTYELMNYQDLPATGRQFDRVVSIGFFEHVGRGNHSTYFKTVSALLKDGGMSVLHCITQPTENPSDPWIDRYIFPGTYIPSVREVTALLPDHKFEMMDYENLGQHYIPTLYGWLERFQQHEKQVIKRYDQRFYLMWLFYLTSSIGTFRAGSINLSQWVFTKGVPPDWPLTRESLYQK